jgi:Xaa-Pro aminopeptidase
MSGGPKLNLDDSQIQHLRRAQELAAKAYAEVLAARMPVSSTSPAIMSGLSEARDLLKALLQEASEY